MAEVAKLRGVSASGAGSSRAGGRAVYYVSDRPEAYEIFGEVTHDEARNIGKLIAERAGRAFPDIEFRVDSAWHSHQQGVEKVAAYIEDHWQDWVGAWQA